MFSLVYAETSRLVIISADDDLKKHGVIRSDLKERKISKDLALVKSYDSQKHL